MKKSLLSPGAGPRLHRGVPGTRPAGRALRRCAAGRLRVGCVGALFLANLACAADVVSIPSIGLELARDLAQAAVDDCRARGYLVTAVVVNRAGDVQVVLRDTLAARYGVQIAGEKAQAVILAGGVPSSEFRARRKDIRMEMDHVDGVLMLEGGLPVRSAGVLIGALGVSGAPGGDRDELCAQAALDKLQERLDFAQ
jgi:uncharacterized protein GlcG (DUF336 family)